MPKVTTIPAEKYNGSLSRPDSRVNPQLRHKRIFLRIVLCILGTILAVVWFQEEERPAVVSILTSTTTKSRNGNDKNSTLDPKILKGFAQNTTENRLEPRTEMKLSHNGSADLLYNRMLKNARREYGQMISNLQIRYGPDYFSKIFMDPNRAEKSHGMFPLSQTSRQRLRQKIKIKLLLRILQLQENSEVPSADPIRLVLATGGHSAAAGHGNLYNESYTAIAEKTLRPFFMDGLGMEFVSRNYAMGNTQSALEISMCAPSIFGTDVDLLIWDYGMTDGNARKSSSTTKLLHYGYRAALSRRSGTIGIRSGNRNDSSLDYHQMPILICMRGCGETSAQKKSTRRKTKLDAGAGNSNEHDSAAATRENRITLKSEQASRFDLLSELEYRGMGILIANSEEYLIPGIPDSTLLSRKNAVLPDGIRNFKCNRAIERGSPVCTAEKYSTKFCPNRSQQKQWHPGVKMHELEGVMIAIFIAQTVLVALQALVENSPSNVEKHLRRLLKEEESRKLQQFQSSKLPKSSMALFKANIRDDGNLAELLEWTYLANTTICHTARLPSEIRYLGYLTNTTRKIGGFAAVGKEKYDRGTSLTKALSSPSLDNMDLAFNPSEREKDCSVPVKVDYRDFFVSAHQKGKSSNGGWNRLIIPNKTEKLAYLDDANQLKGIVGIFFAGCPQSIGCQAKDLRPEDLNSKFEMEVNGIPVDQMFPLG